MPIHIEYHCQLKRREAHPSHVMYVDDGPTIRKLHLAPTMRELITFWWCSTWLMIGRFIIISINWEIYLRLPTKCVRRREVGTGYSQLSNKWGDNSIIVNYGHGSLSFLSNTSMCGCVYVCLLVCAYSMKWIIGHVAALNHSTIVAWTKC